MGDKGEEKDFAYTTSTACNTLRDTFKIARPEAKRNAYRRRNDTAALADITTGCFDGKFDGISSSVAFSSLEASWIGDGRGRKDGNNWV